MASEPQITESELAELIRRMDEAADAYIRGDLHHYVSLFDHSADYTLMPPYGGETTHGFEYTEEGAAETSRFFASGEARLDVQQSYVSVTSPCWSRWSVSTARWAVFLTRLGHCVSPWSFAVLVTGGRSCIATRTRS